jgi:hypothetical protein
MTKKRSHKLTAVGPFLAKRQVVDLHDLRCCCCSVLEVGTYEHQRISASLVGSCQFGPAENTRIKVWAVE